MGYRGEPTGMMTRHHPATGTRMGDEIRACVGKQSRGRFWVDIQLERYQGGRMRRILRQNPCGRSSRVARANGLENLCHSALVAKPPVNLDKSVGRKWRNSNLEPRARRSEVGDASFSRAGTMRSRAARKWDIAWHGDDVKIWHGPFHHYTVIFHAVCTKQCYIMQAYKSSSIFGKSINYAHAKPRPVLIRVDHFKKTIMRKIRVFIKFKIYANFKNQR